MNDIATKLATDDLKDPWAVSNRAEQILLKLLDGIDNDIKNGTLPSPHMETYEALCRAERARSGR